MIYYRALLNSIQDIEGITIAFNILGESNSGGYALNSTADIADLAENPNVMLLNNMTLNSLYQLTIGGVNSNNMIGHVGLSGATHGCDLYLGKMARNGDFGKICFMLKAGQGGAKVGNLYNGGSLFNGVINPWEAFVARSNAYKQLIPNGAIQPIIFFLGINDAIANTSPAVFKSQTKSVLQAIRDQVGGNNYIYYVHMPRTNASYAAIDDTITEMATELDFVREISVVGAMAAMRDQNHFGTSDFKTITDRIVAQIKIDYNI